jgi:hypothetical protein
LTLQNVEKLLRIAYDTGNLPMKEPDEGTHFKKMVESVTQVCFKVFSCREMGRLTSLFIF